MRGAFLPYVYRMKLEDLPRLHEKRNAILRYLAEQYIEGNTPSVTKLANGATYRQWGLDADWKSESLIRVNLSSAFIGDVSTNVKSHLQFLVDEKLIDVRPHGYTEPHYRIKEEGLEFIRDGGYAKTQGLRSALDNPAMPINRTEIAKHNTARSIFEMICWIVGIIGVVASVWQLVLLLL